MQLLKILFFVLFAFVAALFTYGNWQPVPIHLWSGLEALVNLPLLLLATFLFGFVPAHAYHKIRRWRLRQRLVATEQMLADTRALIVPVVAVPATPSPPTPDVPPLPGELA